MSDVFRARKLVATCASALMLAACGGSNGDSTATGPGPAAGSPPGLVTPATPASPVLLAPPANAPLSTAAVGGAASPLAGGDIASDGFEWLAFRRSQAGMSTLLRSAVIDVAALGHSNYLRLNNTITHDQVAGKVGFTGAAVGDRLQAAGYVFDTSNSRAYGEVISASSKGSGQFMAEELITAVYHRFVIFEPVFKEIGVGAAATGQGYNYLTFNLAANNGFGTGLASGQIAVWPFDGQTGITRNFFSDTELPDPVPDRNEVGYPISVHANVDATITVSNFTVRQRGGVELAVRLLSNANDTLTARSSAAIVPLVALLPATTYDVAFTGTVGGIPVSRSWSFTTR